MVSKHTIAGKNQEFVVVRVLVDGDIRESSDDLLLRRHIGTLFELEIADSA